MSASAARCCGVSCSIDRSRVSFAPRYRRSETACTIDCSRRPATTGRLPASSIDPSLSGPNHSLRRLRARTSRSASFAARSSGESDFSGATCRRMRSVMVRSFSAGACCASRRISCSAAALPARSKLVGSASSASPIAFAWLTLMWPPTAASRTAGRRSSARAAHTEPEASRGVSCPERAIQSSSRVWRARIADPASSASATSTAVKPVTRRPRSRIASSHARRSSSDAAVRSVWLNASRIVRTCSKHAQAAERVTGRVIGSTAAVPSMQPRLNEHTDKKL